MKFTEHSSALQYKKTPNIFKKKQISNTILSAPCEQEFACFSASLCLWFPVRDLTSNTVRVYVYNELLLFLIEEYRYRYSVL